VVDTNKKSLKIAQARFEEMPVNKYVCSVLYAESMGDIDRDIDLAIIATNADVRRKVVGGFY